METRTWPIARSNQGGLCKLGIPQRLGDGKLYTHNSYQASPSLDEVVGDVWCPSILAKLIGNAGFAAWWTTTKMLQKSGLSDHAPAALPDQLDLDDPGGRLFVTKSLIPRTKTMVAADLSDGELVALLTQWSGIDTEFDIEFFVMAPGNGGLWEIAPIRHWCGSKKQWSHPEKLIPGRADRVISLYDGDIYCALPEAAAEIAVQSLTDLAQSWQLSVIPGPEHYSWLPNLG